MKVEVMLSSRRLRDETLMLSRPVETVFETWGRARSALALTSRRAAHVNRELPGVHQRLPVRNAEVEVVDKGRDRDRCLGLESARKVRVGSIRLRREELTSVDRWVTEAKNLGALTS